MLRGDGKERSTSLRPVTISTPLEPRDAAMVQDGGRGRADVGIGIHGGVGVDIANVGRSVGKVGGAIGSIRARIGFVELGWVRDASAARGEAEEDDARRAERTDGRRGHGQGRSTTSLRPV